MKHVNCSMGDLFHHALKEKYNTIGIKEPLLFLKSAICQDSFAPLLNDLYHNDTDHDGTTWRINGRNTYLWLFASKAKSLYVIRSRSHGSFSRYLESIPVLTCLSASQHISHWQRLQGTLRHGAIST